MGASLVERRGGEGRRGRQQNPSPPPGSGHRVEAAWDRLGNWGIHWALGRH
jgi:hypothetical protein